MKVTATIQIKLYSDFKKTNVSKDIILIPFPLLKIYKHYMRSNTFWVITSVY